MSSVRISSVFTVPMSLFFNFGISSAIVKILKMAA